LNGKRLLVEAIMTLLIQSSRLLMEDILLLGAPIPTEQVLLMYGSLRQTLMVMTYGKKPLVEAVVTWVGPSSRLQMEDILLLDLPVPMEQVLLMYGSLRQTLMVMTYGKKPLVEAVVTMDIPSSRLQMEDILLLGILIPTEQI